VIERWLPSNDPGPNYFTGEGRALGRARKVHRNLTLGKSVASRRSEPMSATWQGLA
jgi:hypothetical protein